MSGMDEGPVLLISAPHAGMAAQRAASGLGLGERDWRWVTRCAQLLGARARYVLVTANAGNVPDELLRAVTIGKATGHLVEYRPPAAEPIYTREEAISHVFGLSLQVEGEFCVGKRERDALEAETKAALRALGVTDEELTA